MVSVFGDGGCGMSVGGSAGGSVGVWVELNTEVRVRGGVRAKGREQWADRRHDDHDEVKRCVVVRGYGAVVIVGLGEWRRRRRAPS